MQSIKKLLAASAVAMSIGAFAAPAGAVTVVQIGSANSNESVNAFTWTAGAAGTGTLSVDDRLVALNFRDSIFNDGMGQEAYLTFNASAVGVLEEEDDGTLRQTGLGGSFEFWSGENQTGSLLLRGVFDSAWLTGMDAVGTFESTLDNLRLTSDVADISWIILDNATFTFSGLNVAGASNNAKNFEDANNDGALDSFDAAGFGASFSGAVPEPGTWALMILGFGGAGAMLRSRRRTAALTA